MPRALFVYPESPPSYWEFRARAARQAVVHAAAGLLTVAAMFPASWELLLVDLNVEPLDDPDLVWADLVLTSTMVVQRRSLREVLARGGGEDRQSLTPF